MTASKRRALVALASVWVLASAATARGEDGIAEQQAVALFEKGRQLARDGRCVEAIPVLLDSVRRAEGVGALLNLGHCFEALGKSASAHRYFEKAEGLAVKRRDVERQREAATRARAVESDVSFLVVNVPASLRTPETVVRIDGEAIGPEHYDIPLPVDPGSHAIEVHCPGLRQASALIVFGKGDRREWTAAMPTPQLPSEAESSTKSAQPPPPAVQGASRVRGRAQRSVGYATGALGLGGLAVGTIFGVIALNAQSSLLARCSTYPTCPSSQRTELDPLNERAEMAGTVATASLVTGAVLVASALVILLTVPSGHHPSP